MEDLIVLVAMLEKCVILQNTFQKYLLVAVNHSLMYPNARLFSYLPPTIFFMGITLKSLKGKWLFLLPLVSFFFFPEVPISFTSLWNYFSKGSPFLNIYFQNESLAFSINGLLPTHKIALTDENRNSTYGKPAWLYYGYRRSCMQLREGFLDDNTNQI